MTTIDSILPHINQNIKVIEPLIPKKDKRILVSLAKQTSSGVFLTENQAKLLTKILKENINAVRSLFQDIETTISDNLWSQGFRIVKKIRKISIDSENPTYFSVEFNFNTKLKEKITKILSGMSGQVLSKGSKYLFLLNEQNVYLAVSTFFRENFEIDEKIMNFYQEIEKVKSDTSHPFEIFSTKQEKLKKSVIKDVVFIAPENLLMLQDRKIRYQYEISEKIEENTLAAKIANRASRRIYADPQEIPFLELVSSLKELNRLPLMIIFEGHTSEKDKRTLKLVENAVSTLNLGDEIGIYFRYDKENDSANFNQEVALLGYNKNLGDSTVIAGISNNKLPKFMLKSGWKPQTVISFTNSFRANKASVYCMDVDLVIYYTGTQPLDEKIHVLL
jgi:hypothetical protein